MKIWQFLGGAQYIGAWALAVCPTLWCNLKTQRRSCVWLCMFVNTYSASASQTLAVYEGNWEITHYLQVVFKHSFTNVLAALSFYRCVVSTWRFALAEGLPSLVRSQVGMQPAVSLWFYTRLAEHIRKDKPVVVLIYWWAVFQSKHPRFIREKWERRGYLSCTGREEQHA